MIELLNQAAHPERNSVDNVIQTEEWQQLQQVFGSLGKFTLESFRTNRLPLLNLPAEILEALHSGRIAYTKARAIARVKDKVQRNILLEAAVVLLAQARSCRGKAQIPLNPIASFISLSVGC